MVPKIAGKGTSFKGAGLYYLHDKKAATAARVAFTRTENLPTDNAELALRYMAYTAMRQEELKAASGCARTGRKLTQSVYTYSLSWAPGEKPAREEMIEAGRETLKALGLDHHETLMVAHNDEPHPHLHLIVNRVHPATGKAATLSNDRLALSRWAEAYERRQGEIRCEQRVINNAARRQGQFVKDRRSLDAAAFHRWRKEQLRAAFQVRQAEQKNLSAYHQGQRQALHDEKELRIAARRAEIRARNRPEWAALYRRQAQETRALDQTRRSALSRLMYWMRHRQEIGTPGGLAGAFAALRGHYGPVFAGAMRTRHEAERKAMARRVSEQNRQAIREENQAYRAELAHIKQLQAQETRRLKDIHAQQSQDLARGIRERAGEREFQKAAGKEGAQDRDGTSAGTMSEEFNERVGRRIRKARKRDEQRRGKGYGRERED